jgi:hypothetical protein
MPVQPFGYKIIAFCRSLERSFTEAFDFSGGFLAHASPKRHSAKKRWADGGLFRADFFVPHAEFCVFPFSKNRLPGIFRSEPVFLLWGELP